MKYQPIQFCDMEWTVECQEHGVWVSVNEPLLFRMAKRVDGKWVVAAYMAVYHNGQPMLGSLFKERYFSGRPRALAWAQGVKDMHHQHAEMQKIIREFKSQIIETIRKHTEGN